MSCDDAWSGISPRKQKGGGEARIQRGGSQHPLSANRPEGTQERVSGVRLAGGMLEGAGVSAWKLNPEGSCKVTEAQTDSLFGEFRNIRDFLSGNPTREKANQQIGDPRSGLEILGSESTGESTSSR